MLLELLLSRPVRPGDDGPALVRGDEGVLLRGSDGSEVSTVSRRYRFTTETSKRARANVRNGHRHTPEKAEEYGMRTRRNQHGVFPRCRKEKKP